MTSKNYNPSEVVICFDHFKDAALYFDRVLPFNFTRMRGNKEINDMLIGYPEAVPSRVLSQLIDGVEVQNNSFTHADRIMNVAIGIWHDFAISVLPYANLFEQNEAKTEEHPKYLDSENNKLLKAYLANAKVDGKKSIRELFNDYASKVGFNQFAVVMFNNYDSASSNSDPSITLSQLNLVDTSNAEWDQIIDVRKDKESHQRLIKLKLFMNKNYSDSSFSYIEDDISARLFDYDLVCQKFGFKTMTSSISALLDSKSLHTSIGAGLVAGLFGGPIAGVSTGAAIEVGKILVQIAEKKHDMNFWKQGHDLAYIFETRKKIT